MKPAMELELTAGIDALIFKRKAEAEKCYKVNSIQSAISARINEMRAQCGVSKALEQLKYDNTALSEYIHNLEMINGGIWCSKCAQLKTIEFLDNAALGEFIAAPENRVPVIGELRKKVAELGRDIARLQESLRELPDLENRLAEIESRANAVNTALAADQPDDDDGAGQQLYNDSAHTDNPAPPRNWEILRSDIFD